MQRQNGTQTLAADLDPKSVESNAQEASSAKKSTTATMMMVATLQQQQRHRTARFPTIAITSIQSLQTTTTTVAALLLNNVLHYIH